MRRLGARWGPVVGWMALIFVLSAQTALPSLVPSPFQEVVSKAAHLLEYAILAALLARAAAPPRPPLSLPVGLALWLATSLYGVTDELHQSFVPSRNASVDDLAADALGALLGLLLLYHGRARRFAKKEGAQGAPPPAENGPTL